jgi:acyl-CoA synthetase (AMP-forming)/AMP-acid ligase II
MRFVFSRSERRTTRASHRAAGESASYWWAARNRVRKRPHLILYPPGLDFVAAFFGALYAGAAAIPAHPPHPASALDARGSKV